MILYMPIAPVYACTTIMVGKKVSNDGSHYIGRTTDTRQLEIAKLVVVPRSDSKGAHVFVDSQNGFRAELPNRKYRCIILPINAGKQPEEGWESGINEKDIGISATETIRTNDRILAVDPFVPNGIAESNIPVIVLPYIDSARAGVERLGALVDRYGMSSAEAVAFIDEKEIWYMEIYSGHQWAAQRMPADVYACIGNDCILGHYDAADNENWIASESIEETARKAGQYRTIDGRFHLAASYAPAKRDYSQLRIWAGRRYFNPSTTGAYDVHTQYEIFAKPEMKISLEKAFALTRDRHEGTDMATEKHGNTRPIGIDRTTQSHFIQFSKGRTPVMWSCMGAPEFALYVPVYATAGRIPHEFANAPLRYASDSFSWQVRVLCDLAARNRARYSAIVRERYAALEKEFISIISRDGIMSEAAANASLKAVARKALQTTHEITRDLVTRFSEDSVNATKTLGKD